MSESVTSWSLADEEVAKVVCSGNATPSSPTQKLYITKLMPQISFGNPKTTTVGINKSCLCNDTKCKPSVGSTVTAQNYITLSTQANRNFKLNWFHKGDKLQIEIRNKNPDDMFLSTKVDPSTLLP